MLICIKASPYSHSCGLILHAPLKNNKHHNVIPILITSTAISTTFPIPSISPSHPFSLHTLTTLLIGSIKSILSLAFTFKRDRERFITEERGEGGRDDTNDEIMKMCTAVRFFIDSGTNIWKGRRRNGHKRVENKMKKG